MMRQVDELEAIPGWKWHEDESEPGPTEKVLKQAFASIVRTCKCIPIPLFRDADRKNGRVVRVLSCFCRTAATANQTHSAICTVPGAQEDKADRLGTDDMTTRKQYSKRGVLVRLAMLSGALMRGARVKLSCSSRLLSFFSVLEALWAQGQRL